MQLLNFPNMIVRVGCVTGGFLRAAFGVCRVRQGTLAIRLLIVVPVSLWSASYSVPASADSDWIGRARYVDGGHAVMAVRDKRFKAVLELTPPRAVLISPEVKASSREGTISFWVKPAWPAGDGRSHTLLSANWSDRRHSYMAISSGWWEPGGANRLYFIVSNEDIVHCSADRQLPSGVWSLITAVWSVTDRTDCRLFIDDELVAHTVGKRLPAMTIGTIYLGTDKVTSNHHGRTAAAAIAGLRIMRHAYSHRSVLYRYAQEESQASLYDKKWRWLEDDEIADGGIGRKERSGRVRLAIFDEDMSWAVSKEAIDSRLRRIADAGFNIYVPCIWHGSGAWFPSKVAAPDARLKGLFASGWDPLEYLIERAHRLNIEVHPWVTVVRRTTLDHPEWAQQGVPSGAYDVHEHGFRDFIVDVMVDVVRRYDVDGMNLDYIRAMGVCTSAHCRDDYLHAMHANLDADIAHSTDAPARARIAKWQDTAVEAIVSDFSLRARKLKSHIEISVDSHVATDEAKRPLEGRNAVSWANRGLIDRIYDMDYRRHIDASAIVQARRTLRDPSKLSVLLANYDLIDGVAAGRSPRWLRDIITFTLRRTPGATLGIYLYGQLTEEQSAALKAYSATTRIAGD